MYVLGFSLNNLTLVAIVISVGFVVDDAIVVVENIHRHLEAGDDSRTGAQGRWRDRLHRGVDQLADCRVHPAAVHGRCGRRLFKEFALTATTILISVVVSLTLAPTLCALFMRRPPGEHTALASAWSGGTKSLDRPWPTSA
jgi:HAE1 family hydrophobic/amphiphilic exporter-1